MEKPETIDVHRPVMTTARVKFAKTGLTFRGRAVWLETEPCDDEIALVEKFNRLAPRIMEAL